MKRFLSIFVLASWLAAVPCFSQSKTVEIFVTSWCPYCMRLESFLKKNDIDYTRYDVERDAKGARIFTELGGEGVPLSRVGKQVIHGFDPERILAALNTDA